MNGIVKAALRLPSLRSAVLTAPILSQARISVGKDLTRGIRHMCAPRAPAAAALLNNHSSACSCGCGLKGIHTKDNLSPIKTEHPEISNGERELVEFLTEEIVAENKARKVPKLPTELDGFKIESHGAEISLSKKDKDETVSISLNVNHTVDSEDHDEMDQSQHKNEEIAEMRSRPQFEIDVVKGQKTLSFTCSFVDDAPPSEGDDGFTNDVFGIDEVTYYEGEFNDKVYAVAGDVLDGYLYDLLMNILEEKGISNEFAQKLSDVATAYEHNEYIKFLQNMSQFTIAK